MATDPGRQTPHADGQEPTWTVGRLLEWTTNWFREKHVEGGRLSAELLLAHAMGCKKIDLYTRYDYQPTEQQRTAFRELVRSAGQHTPIAYLLGTREFFSLDFEVSPAVLIPRPETEALAQRMIDLCRKSPDRQWQILDVGTGSGCIAITIAYYAKNASALGADISAPAIEIATRNIDRHGLSDRVRLVEADGVNLPAEYVPAGGFDAIVSNPPYIREDQWAELPPNVRNHEPKLALSMDGSDGLVMYRRLATEASSVLKPGGRMLIEIGYDQDGAVRDVFASAGGWTYIGSHSSPTDPYERVLEFVY